MGVSVATFYCS